MTTIQLTRERPAGRLSNPRLPVLLRLVARALPYKRSLVVASLVLVTAAALDVAAPALVGVAIDAGLDIATVEGVGGVEETVARGTIATLLLAVGLLLLVGVARGVFKYGQAYIGEQISQQIAYDFRNDIYDHLQRLSYAYHDRAQIGQIMSRATQDVEGVRMFVSMGVLRFLYVLALCGAVYALMLVTNLKVGLVALAFAPLIAIQGTWSSWKLRKVWLHVQELQGQMANVLQENLTGQRVVKAFSRTEFEQQKFDAKVDELFVHSYSTSKFQAFNEPFLQALWLLSLAVVFWLGAQEVQAGRMATGELAAFLLWLTLLQVPVRSIGWIIMMFARAHSTGSRIFEILDAESAVQEKPDAAPIRAERGEVLFEDVSFEYDAASPVLSHVDIDAEPGQTIALLGRTGSGKSTVVNLLPRFYDVSGGRITIDGQDVRDVTLDSLRDAIGIVQQDLFLFIGDDPRQHPLRAAGRQRRGDRRGGEERAHPRVHRGDAARLRHLGRRARRDALGRPAATDLDRAHVVARSAGADPRRLDGLSGHAHGVRDPRGAADADGGSHDVRDRAAVADGEGGGPDPRAQRGRDRRARTPRGAARAGRLLPPDLRPRAA